MGTIDLRLVAMSAEPYRMEHEVDPPPGHAVLVVTLPMDDLAALIAGTGPRGVGVRLKRDAMTHPTSGSGGDDER